MNRAFASFRLTLSALLAPPALLGFLAIHVVVLAMSLASTAIASDQAFVARGQIVGLLFWIPGLFVAARIREAWPALGPGDAGLRWIRNLGIRVSVPVLGCACAALVGLVGLQCASGVLAGLGLGAGDRFRVTHRLTPIHGQASVLARAGHTAAFAVAATDAATELAVAPTFLLGPRESIRVDVDLVLGSHRKRLAPLTWPDLVGSASTKIAEPVPAGAEVHLVRAAGKGPPIVLEPGSVTLRTHHVAAPAATTLISLRRFPWAVLLLAVSLALAGWIGRELQVLAVLAIAPVLAAFPGTGWDEPGNLLATAACPQGLLPPGPLALAMLTGLVLAVLAPRTVRGPVTES